MGKKLKIKLDGGTFKNVVKNFTPVGYAAGAAQALGLTNRNLVDQSSDAITKLLTGGGRGSGGGGGAAGPDISATAKQYEELANQARISNLAAGQQLTQQLQQQATGQAPSLAEAQLKAASNRNLAQTLAAAQTANASPLTVRNMLQLRGQQAREVGEQAAQAKLQERQQAQSMLGQQIASQAGISRADIGQGFEIGKTPAEYAQQRQMAQMQIQAQKDLAAKQQQSGILGGLLQGGATLGAAYLMSPAALASDEDNKEAPKKSNKNKEFAESLMEIGAPKDLGEAVGNMGKIGAALLKQKYAMSDEDQKTELPKAADEVNEMMDKLEPKKYQYKDTSLPGTAEGTRYGIIAQDLEKSSLGKTLVKNTPHGKMVDTVQGFGAVLAAQAELNRRLKKLEKKGK